MKRRDGIDEEGEMAFRVSETSAEREEGMCGASGAV